MLRSVNNKMRVIKKGATWDEGVVMPQFPVLRGQIETEAVIVGGGLTGLTAAYFLDQAGRRAAVLERNKLGNGATGATTKVVPNV
jgi:ribulose 1,5-bisphosphate synthetase/thiazole synthase